MWFVSFSFLSLFCCLFVGLFFDFLFFFFFGLDFVGPFFLSFSPGNFFKALSDWTNSKSGTESKSTAKAKTKEGGGGGESKGSPREVKEWKDCSELLQQYWLVYWHHHIYQVQRFSEPFYIFPSIIFLQSFLFGGGWFAFSVFEQISGELSLFCLGF